MAPLVLVGTRGRTAAMIWLPSTWPCRWAGEPLRVRLSPQPRDPRNAERTGAFTVSFPRPDTIVEVALAAEPGGRREAELGGDRRLAGRVVDGVLVDDAHLWLECQLERVIDGFGRNTLIAGRVVAASVAASSLRASMPTTPT